MNQPVHSTATTSDSVDSPSTDSQLPLSQSRRGFVAAAIGFVAGIGPVLIGLVVLIDPLRRRKSGGRLIRVASLDAVPADGRPYRFPVVADRTDAWIRHAPRAIGSVYLRRTADDQQVEAFSSICPHLGCAVDFRPNADRFLCPCHNSMFHLDGSRVDPDNSPSPRDLDTLEVKIQNDREVWVDYRRFVGGKREKIEE